MRDLIDAHNKSSNLERAIQKERTNLIEAFKNRDSDNSQWYITKITFNALSAELKKECDKFSALIQQIDQTQVNEIESTDECKEIIENVNDLSSSSELEEIEVNSLYNESIPMNDEQFIQRSASRISVKIESEPKMSESSTFVQMSEADLVSVSVPVPVITSKVNTPKNTTPRLSTPAPKKKKIVKRIPVSAKVNSGYKYGGKGFKFSGKPHYSATTLICYETRNKNEKSMKNYLNYKGKFNKDTIESINFKFNSYHGNYALIKVRAPLKTIKNKIRQLNKSEDKNIIRILEPRQYLYSNDVNNATDVPYEQLAVVEPLLGAEECKSLIDVCGKLGDDPSSNYFVKRTKKIAYVAKIQGEWHQIAKHANYFIQNAAYNDLSGGYKREYEVLPPEYIKHSAVIKALDAFQSKFNIPDGSLILTQVQTSHINTMNSLAAKYDVHVDNNEDVYVPQYNDEEIPTTSLSATDRANFSITGQGIHSDGVNHALIVCLQRKNVNGALSSFYNNLSGTDVYLKPFVLNVGHAAYWHDNKMYHWVSPASLKDKNKNGERTILLFSWPGKYSLNGQENPDNTLGRLEKNVKLREIFDDIKQGKYGTK